MGKSYARRAAVVAKEKEKNKFSLEGNPEHGAHV